MSGPASFLSALLPASGTVSGPLSAADSIGLVQALKAVPDPRRRRGRRHGLHLGAAARAAGGDAGASSWVAIAQWAAARQGLSICGSPPSASTFPRVLAAVDVMALEATLTRWASARRAAAARPGGRPGQTRAEQRTVLAVAGKTLRGSRAITGVQTKLVCGYDHASGLVLTQAAVADGEEIAAFTTALSCLPELAGCLITADALHCQRGHAEFLTARGGHYLFTVKANQPTLRQALRRLPWAAAGGSGRRDRGHGRTESRSIKVLTATAPTSRACSPRLGERSRSSTGAPPPTGAGRSRPSTR
jgi:predicted transposase YbfD/YdcC